MTEPVLRVDLPSLDAAASAVAATGRNVEGAGQETLPAMASAARAGTGLAAAGALGDVQAACGEALSDVLAALSSLARGLEAASDAFAANDAAAAAALPTTQAPAGAGAVDGVADGRTP